MFKQWQYAFTYSEIVIVFWSVSQWFFYNLSDLFYAHFTHNLPEQSERGADLWLKHIILRFWWKRRRDRWLEKLPLLNPDKSTVCPLASSDPVKKGIIKFSTLCLTCVCAIYYWATVNSCDFTHFLSPLICNERHHYSLQIQWMTQHTEMSVI